MADAAEVARACKVHEEKLKRIAAGDSALRNVPDWLSRKEQREWRERAVRMQLETPSSVSSSLSLTDPSGMVLCGPIRPSVR